MPDPTQDLLDKNLRIPLPTGGAVVFPAGMSRADMDEALLKLPAQQRAPIELALSQLPQRQAQAAAANAPPKTLGDRVEGIAAGVDKMIPRPDYSDWSGTDSPGTSLGPAQRAVRFLRNEAGHVGALAGGAGGRMIAGPAGGVAGAAIGGMADELGKGKIDLLGGDHLGANVTGQDLKNLGTHAASDAGWQLGGEAAAQALSRWGVPVAVKLWKKAAKPTEAALKTTNTYRGGGSLPEAADEVAHTVLDRGMGRISDANAAGLKGAINTLDDRLTDVIKNSTGTVQRQDIAAALADAYQQITPGTQAADQLRRGILRSYALLKQQGQQIPVQVAQQMKRDIYGLGNYAVDATDAGLAAAEKIKGRALRSEIAAAEPAAESINSEMSRLIPAAKVMGQAANRAGKRDVVSLPEIIAATQAGHNPRAAATTGMAIFNRPGVTSWTAQQLYTIGQAAKNNPAVWAMLPQSIRTAIGGLGDQIQQP